MKGATIGFIIFVIIATVVAVLFSQGYIPGTTPHTKKMFEMMDTDGYTCEMFRGADTSPTVLFSNYDEATAAQEAINFWEKECEGVGGGTVVEDNTGGSQPVVVNKYQAFFDLHAGKPPDLVLTLAQTNFDSAVTQNNAGSMSAADFDTASSILVTAVYNNDAAVAQAAGDAEEVERLRVLAEETAAQAALDAEETARLQQIADAAAAEAADATSAAGAAALVTFQEQVMALTNPSYASQTKFMMAPGDGQTVAIKPGLTPQNCISECDGNAGCVNVQFLNTDTNCYQIINDSGTPAGGTMKYVNDTLEKNKFKRGFRKVNQDTGGVPGVNNKMCGEFIANSIANSTSKDAPIWAGPDYPEVNLSDFCSQKNLAIDNWGMNAGADAYTYRPVCRDAYMNGCKIPCTATIYGGADFTGESSSETNYNHAYLSDELNEGNDIVQDDLTKLPAGSGKSWNDKIRSVIMGPGCERMEWDPGLDHNSSYFSTTFADEASKMRYFDIKGNTLGVGGASTHRTGAPNTYNHALSPFMRKLDDDKPWIGDWNPDPTLQGEEGDAAMKRSDGTSFRNYYVSRWWKGKKKDSWYGASAKEATSIKVFPRTVTQVGSA